MSVALSNSFYAISSLVKTTLTREEGHRANMDALRYCIYRKYNGIMHDSSSLAKELALAQKNYPRLPLFTYNYDTFVERQYYHDFHKELKYYCGGTIAEIRQLSSDHVIHLHGYISYTKNHAKGVILTDEDYCDAYLNKGSWVYKAQTYVLENYTCLFVGSSMSDIFQMSTILNAKNDPKNLKWNCFALMCFGKLNPKEKMVLLKHYKEKGIRIIFVDDFADLPTKLHEIFV